jgi:hypothetical protein
MKIDMPGHIVMGRPSADHANGDTSLQQLEYLGGL